MRKGVGLKKGKDAEDRFYLICGLILCASEVWKQFTLTFVTGGGKYQWSYLPFQLCSLPMYLCLLIWIFRRNAGLRRAFITFLADFTLLSGSIVVLDTTGMRYDYFPLTVHSYLWHISITLIGLYSGASRLGERRTRPVADFLPALGIYLVSCALAELINLTFDRYGVVNMFYINPHYYMDQIVFRELRGIFSNNTVILIYVASVAAGAFLVHLAWNGAGAVLKRRWKGRRP